MIRYGMGQLQWRNTMLALSVLISSCTEQHADHFATALRAKMPSKGLQTCGLTYIGSGSFLFTPGLVEPCGFGSIPLLRLQIVRKSEQAVEKVC
jgi:hypothetical protein